MSAQMRERERRQEPHWFVYEPSSMPSRRWVRWLWDWERRTGRQDTGDVLFGSYEDVRRRAGQNQVRPPFLRRVSTHERLPRIGVAQGRRAVLKAAGLSWAAGLLGVPVGSGLGGWFWQRGWPGCCSHGGAQGQCFPWYADLPLPRPYGTVEPQPGTAETPRRTLEPFTGARCAIPGLWH